MSLNIEGHMGLKSSPLATTSCKLTKQFLVLQHLNAHHKKLSNVKSSIDTTCPKTWYKHMNVKDQIKRERSARNTNRSRPLSAKSQDLSLYSLESPILEVKSNGTFQSPNSARNMKEKPNDLNIMEIEKNDILDKNGKRFTEQKSFTPRILKNDKTSKLTQLRCYNAPKHKSREKVVEMELIKENDIDIVSEDISEKLYNPQQSSPEKTLSEEEIRLKELDFLKDLTDDILIKHNFTDIEVEQTCDYHIKRNKYDLKQEEMRKLCAFVIENTRGMQQYSPGLNQSYIDEIDGDSEYYHSKIESDVIKQDVPFESSAAPSRFQISNEGLESTQPSYNEENILYLSKSNSPDLQDQIEDVRNKLDSLKLPAYEQINETNIEGDSLKSESQLTPDETTKNVHFASQNETFSAQETDRSLTHISSIQAENSDDSTSVNLSIELNQTYKTALEDSYLEKMHEYDEDFDD